MKPQAKSVTPTFEQQVVPTAKKLMQKDVTIRKRPQYEVSNDSSGYTLIIGCLLYTSVTSRSC